MAKVIDKSLLINVLSLLAYRGTSFIFPLVTLPYLARILGVEHMGLLALGLACVMYCSTISDWGSMSTPPRTLLNIATISSE